MVLTEDSTNSRFEHHVSFDNFAAAEPTRNNSISFCLNVKHTGYQFKRRSRTFMVGIDENDYSTIALQWMLEELVDDGDEIVCLRVVERGAKIINNSNVEMKKYQKEAKDLLERIQRKNDDNRAISIVLEFAVGKVSNTFMKMVSRRKGDNWVDILTFLFRYRSMSLRCLLLALEVEVLGACKGSSASATLSRNGVSNTRQSP